MTLFLKYRWYISGFLVVLALAGIPFLQKAIVPNNSLSIWFLEDDPALVGYHQFHQTFGNDEVVALVVHDEGGIFQQQVLSRIQNLTTSIEQIRGVSKVFSITNVRDLGYTDGSISYFNVIPDTIPEDLSELKSLRTRAMRSPIIADRLIDETGTTAMMIIQMSVMEDIDKHRDEIIRQISTTAQAHMGREDVYLGGIGVIYSGLNIITQHDFGLFILLSYLMMFLLIGVLYGRVRLVLYTIATIATATVLTLEIYGALGYSINIITMIIPTLIMILGIMDVMHVINEFYFLRSKKGSSSDPKQLTKETLRHVLKPCLYTTLTTMAGFLALTSSPIAVLKEFGIFASVGIVLALVCTYAYGGVFLPNLKPPRKKHFSTTLMVPLLHALLDRIYRYNGIAWVGLISLILVLGYGASRVVTDTDTMEYLPAHHRAVTDHEAIQQYWGEYIPLEFTIKPHEGRDVKHPDIISASRAFVNEAGDLEDVSNGFGLHSVYDRVFPMVYGAFWKRMIESPREVNRITEMAEERDPELLWQLTDSTYSIARITLIGRWVSARRLNSNLDTLQYMADRHFEGLADVSPTGYVPLFSHIADYVLLSQKRSFGLAIGLIFTLMLFMLRSLRLALVAIIPNLFPVLLLLGTMGYMGITLDIATATIAAIVLGFSIDDTIHFIYHYRYHKKRTSNVYKAKKMALSHVGNAIVFTSLVIFVGYLVLLFAEVKTVYYFGLLTAISVIGALFAQLVIFPLMLKAFDTQPPKVSRLSKA